MQITGDDRLVGRVLEGRYRVQSRLARGGMSTVYTALDERLDRQVAVKVMSAQLSADPAFAGRFAREARIAVRLSHPNAVSVYDQGTDDGHVFLVMELVRGRTLRDLLRERGPLSAATAVSIMEPVLGALAAAHRAGLVHRDVKPENILLADDGAVKVADFGLAHAIERDGGSTRTGLMMGTVAYCPPEQLARGVADARSDVYSAGIVLFELLTGAPPYTGDTAMAVAYQHVNTDVPPPSSRQPGVSPVLDDLVRRATSREPSARPLDAGAMLAELHDARVDLGLPIVAVSSRLRPSDLDLTQPIGVVPTHQPGWGQAEPDWDGTAATTALGAHPGPVAAGPQHTAVVGTQPGDRQTRPPARVADSGRSKRPLPPGRARRRRARRRGLIVVILVLLLGAATGYGAWYYTVGRYHSLPDVLGQSQSAAAAALSTDGYSVDPTVQQQFSETAPVGSVIATSPKPTAKVLHGRTVTLIVSKGPERFTVPDVAGKTLDQAKSALSSIPVAVLATYAANDTVKVGVAIGSTPAKGAAVKRNSSVTVQISTGPPIINIPDVGGKTQTDASAALKKAGFDTAVTQDYNDTVPSGSVISQTPKAGTPQVKFSTVIIDISKGPQYIAVPDIQKGDDPNSATVALTNAGLQYSIVKDGNIFNKILNNYRVDNVDPPSGTMVRPGSTVILTLK